MDEEMLLAGPSYTGNIDNPFDGTVSYGGEIFDGAGNEVMFSAGKVPEDSSEPNLNLWRAMENVEYCDHTIFADMTPMMADFFDKTDDCTVSEAVRAMAAMGLDDSDEEDSDEPSSAEFDDWAPHGSKSIRGFIIDYVMN
ncbi:hypothetical protein B0H13DRAFT_2331953 [Mycena leptocephala]|nr:hypothetical protein B0H13DRAFT_2331953 [Mycena leptocephala]